MATYNPVSIHAGMTYFASRRSRGGYNSSSSSSDGNGCILGLLFLYLLVGLIILSILITGSAVWSIYTYSTLKSKWHTVGSLALGLVSMSIYSTVYTYAEYPTMTVLAYTLNGLGVLISLIYIFKD